MVITKRFIHSGGTVLAVFAFLAQPGIGQSGSQEGIAASSPAAITIPSGQKFILRLETPVHTHSTRKGDRIEFATAGDVYSDNQVVIPSQSTVKGTVMRAKRAGRLAGRAEVELRLDEVRLTEGTVFPLRATIIRVGLDPIDSKNGPPRIKGESGAGGNIGAVAQAGAQGAIIGVLTAGAKGAMYGSGIAAGISLASMVFKRGPDLDLPRDTMFEARFDQPLAVPVAVVQRIEQESQRKFAETRSEDSRTETTRSVLQKPVLHKIEKAEKAPVEASANPQPSPEITSTTNPPVEETRAVTPSTAKPQEGVASKGSEPVFTDSGAGMYKLSVSVKLVQVDTVVRDRGGRMIENLKKEDFRIFEDGTEQSVQSLSRDELPLAVALVIDRSGSVAPFIFELRRIATDALEQLKPNDQVALFSFASTVDRVEELTANRQRIVNGINRIQTGGGTNIIDALFDATTYLARVAPDHRRAIILISDNQATVHPAASEGDTIRMAMESETVIYSIKTEGEGIPLTMQLPNLLSGAGSVPKVTRETGGEIIDARNVGMLNSALAAVVARLRLRYALGYYPSNQDRGGAFHSIEVRLVERHGKLGSDYVIHARRGYYSTGEAAPSRAKP